MARWLRGAEELRPRVVDASLAEEEAAARVTAGFARGEVFLKDAAGEVLRVVFDGDGEPRAVPAGRYRLFGYRIVDGGWMVSTTGGQRAVDLAAGEAAALEIDPRVHFEAVFRRRGAEPGVNAALRGADGLGLTIYREGKRIELPLAVTRDGRTLVRSRLEYG